MALGRRNGGGGNAGLTDRKVAAALLVGILVGAAAAAASHARAVSRRGAAAGLRAREGADALGVGFGAAVEAVETAGAAAGAPQRGQEASPWAPLRPSAELAARRPELAETLGRVAKDGEVLIAISNNHLAGRGRMLDTWIDGVLHAKVPNALVVALDDQTAAFAREKGLDAVRYDAAIPSSQKNVGMNHAVSGLKFQIIADILKLGYSVLVSDVDIVILSDPFKHLVRDSDIESMSDGWDEGTAYGYNDVLDDPSMGWARYVHSMRVFVFNSGFFYAKSTPAALDVMDRVADRLSKEKAWDQAVFNEVLHFPSSPRSTATAARRRAMDIYKFANSKVMFKRIRKEPALKRLVPVVIHVNFHPDKHQRMLAIWKYYVDGDKHTLDSFPDGSQ